MESVKRRKNERQFGNWKENETGERTYWMEIVGRFGWKARYIKIVDVNENTMAFRQEIFDEYGVLREIHEKFPVDKGHQKLDRHDN
jgi:hypothetical protein